MNMLVCIRPVCQATQAKQDGEPYGRLAATVKLFAFDRMMRDIKITKIDKGPSEVQRMVISGWRA